MANIHATAVVDPSAELGADVEIGPFCVVGPQVKLGDGVVLHSHVAVVGRTTIGDACQVFPFASIGHIPQDRNITASKAASTSDRTPSSASTSPSIPAPREGASSREVGSHCLLMVGAHVAHDCQVGDNVILVNNATLAGHVAIGDHAILGGLCAVHQFVRIGAYGFVGGMSGVEKDVIPFGMVLGNRAYLSRAQHRRPQAPRLSPRADP